MPILTAEAVRTAITRPWMTMKPFCFPGLNSQLPECYRKFYWEWKISPKENVHQELLPDIHKRKEDGTIKIMKDVPIPIKNPKQLHEGLWGGEAVVVGFIKRHMYKRRVPRYWVPQLLSTVVYSEILDKHMRMIVTERALQLIDQHYGLDSYLLENSASNLVSTLALKLKREILMSLAQETLYPNDAEKRKELLQKYKTFIIPEEDAEWYGLTLDEAREKQSRIIIEINKPLPLKHAFRREFYEFLRTNKDLVEKKEEEESPKSSWLTTMNPFGKKDQ